MGEGFSRQDFGSEENRSELIKARAFFDAVDYVRLMENISPESLVPPPGGEISIDTIGADEIFNRVKVELGLTPDEMLQYVVDLASRVKVIISQ